jgi:hypothetical protein
MTDSQKLAELQREVNHFLIGSSWEKYKDQAESVQIHWQEQTHTVHCGLYPFRKLEQALKDSQ